MSVLRWFAMPPPDAAVEIGPDAVTIAVVGDRASDVVLQGYAVEPLAAGAVAPSLTARNLNDREAVVTALGEAVDRLGLRPKRIALVVPDPVAKVSLVRFDQVPASRTDLDQLIRWQVRKSAPFPIDDAQVAWTPAARNGAGGEFLVLISRREVVREYESVCEEVGMHPGIVDLSTLSVINLFLGAKAAPAGDWLVVHMRPDCTALAIVRDGDVAFFRTRPEGEEEPLADVVHQTTMYYQDRLSGQGFSRVLLGGTGRGQAAIAAARRSLEDRLRQPTEPIDPSVSVALAERGRTQPELMAALAPALGLLLRTRVETVGA